MKSYLNSLYGQLVPKKPHFPLYFRYTARPRLRGGIPVSDNYRRPTENGIYHFKRIKSGKYTAVYNKRIGAVEMRAKGTVYARVFSYWEEARRTMNYLNKML